MPELGTGTAGGVPEAWTDTAGGVREHAEQPADPPHRNDPIGWLRRAPPPNVGYALIAVCACRAPPVTASRVA
ncbi:hypothetical protein GCM10023336_74150 [Streptomyces similanensis]|uniref:Uncharacterized protein n=1 Tax=Streptomyces similanensis TaxID=1274988 RepID=A0ABP9LLG6_9ACTN